MKSIFAVENDYGFKKHTMRRAGSWVHFPVKFKIKFSAKKYKGGGKMDGFTMVM